MCDCKIPDPLEFNVDDQIQFEYFNGHRWLVESGCITDIGKHGYWVKTNGGTYGTARIRCPFKHARRK